MHDLCQYNFLYAHKICTVYIMYHVLQKNAKGNFEICKYMYIVLAMTTVTVQVYCSFNEDLYLINANSFITFMFTSADPIVDVLSG